MSLCWLFGHVWAVTYTSRPLIAYRNHERSSLRARFCVCCGAHQIYGALP